MPNRWDRASASVALCGAGAAMVVWGESPFVEVLAMFTIGIGLMLIWKM